MNILHEATFLYMSVEDRICIAAITVSGQPLRLWLTRRLALQLAYHLPSDVLPADRRISSEVLSKPAPKSTDMNLNCLPAVHRECVEFLITSIDIKTRDDQLCLVFRGGKAHQKAAIGLASGEVHHIAKALVAYFQKADWSAGDCERVSSDQSSQSTDNVVIH